MKKRIWKSALAPLAMALAFNIVSTGSASAYAINSGVTDVGGLDTLLRIDFLANSGDQTVVEWINKVLNKTFTTADINKYSAQTWFDVDNNGGDIKALDLVTDGGYFFIKTGNFVVENLPNGVTKNTIKMPDHFLFQNEASSDWAVVAFSQMTASLEKYLAGLGYANATVKSFDVDKFSHIDEFGEITPPSEIPEPATMLLFGAGLVSLAGVSRRTRRK